MVEEKVPDGDNKDKLVINQPAGHIENNETFIDAVIRETLEETRWGFIPQYISGIYRLLHDNSETYLRVCFVGAITKEDTSLELDTGIERTIWLSEQEIKSHKNLRSPLVIKSIEDYLSGSKYPLSLIQDMPFKL